MRRGAPSTGVIVLLTVLAAGTGATVGGPGIAVAPAAPRIAVLISQDAEPYQAALAGFRRSLEQHGSRAAVDVYPLQGDPAAAGAALERARGAGAQLLLTLGSLATRAAARHKGRPPIVAGMILTADDLAGVDNATCVVLEFPVETELRWLQRLLPGQKNVGVLFNPGENQARIDAATRAAAGAGITLFARKVDSPREIPDALDSLARRADVLWGIPDQVVLTPETVKPILLFSMRNRIPFVGLSSTWVRAGALYALERDYGDIGAQCAELAVRILGGAPAGSLPPTSPRKVLYAVNMKTAKIMKLDLEPGVVRAASTVIE